MKAKKILAKTPDNKSNNTQPDSIGACFQSKVDGGGNNDGAKNPKEKMKKAKNILRILFQRLSVTSIPGKEQV